MIFSFRDVTVFEGHPRDMPQSWPFATLKHGSYDLEDLLARGIHANTISGMQVVNNPTSVMVFSEPHFQGSSREFASRGGIFDFVANYPDWNDRIQSMIVVPSAEVPSVIRQEEYQAYWEAQKAKARAVIAQRETDRQRAEAERQSAAALEAARAQAAAALAAQQAQVEAAQKAAELQRQLAEQRAQAEARAAAKAAADAELAAARAEAAAYEAEVKRQQDEAVAAAVEAEKARIVADRAAEAERTVTAARSNSGTLLIVGAVVGAAYLYKRSRSSK